MQAGLFRFKFLATVILAASPLLAVGCAAHASYGYRVYDNSYGDYHVYDRNEEGYYNRWVVETNRPHRDFKNSTSMTEMNTGNGGTITTEDSVRI